MPAVRPHSTPTVDRPWDAGRARRRLRDDESAAYYRRAHAYQKPGTDGRDKEDWKFIHHEVSEDGEIGAANIRAAINGIQILNGGRGGADIEVSARRGVWQHLARHLRDAGREPPPLRSDGEQVEVRAFPGGFQLLSRGESDESPSLVGYAAVFGVRTDLGPFTEEIAPGAFRKVLSEDPDVVALFNHDANFPLGRVSAGTLKLEEDEHGLRYEVPQLPKSRVDLLEAIERRDVQGNSFSFLVGKDEWLEGEKPHRRILEVSFLRDVGPVTFPAYPDTTLALRSLQEFMADSQRPLFWRWLELWKRRIM